MSNPPCAVGLCKGTVYTLDDSLYAECAKILETEFSPGYF